MSTESANINLAPCPDCGGTGWELVEGKGVRPCRCKRAVRGDFLLQQSRIPTRFASCTFDNFEPRCPSLHRALMTSKKFVDEYPLVDVGLLYLGSCGVGKTHLAVSVLRELIRKGIAGLFYDFRDLLKEWHGEEAGAKVKYAEAFEICEYGRRPDKAELKRLFPFF